MPALLLLHPSLQSLCAPWSSPGSERLGAWLVLRSAMLASEKRLLVGSSKVVVFSQEQNVTQFSYQSAQDPFPHDNEIHGN